MRYKNIKVLSINPVVYLGEEYRHNHWAVNQKIFKEKIKDLHFDVSFGIECPIEDLIDVQINYEDTLEPLARKDTIDKIFKVTKELIIVFRDTVKINIYLDDYIENVGNSIDMTIEEFTDWLREELNDYNNK